MRILNFGSMNLDYVYRVPYFVKPGETLAAYGQKITPGGKGLNQSIALARAGADVFHAGCVGKGGDMLGDLLEDNGINIRYLKKCEELQGNAIIQVDDKGENCILLFGGSNRCNTRDQIDMTLRSFYENDFLLIQNEINDIDYIIDQAAEKGMEVIFNPSPFEEKLKTLDYKKVSWLLVNEVEAEQLTGNKEPELVWRDLHRQYPQLSVVITVGSKGAYCFSSQETVYQPAIRTQVVDTTAAGDTFTGYFLKSLSEKCSLKCCMKRAAIASSIAVSRAGACSSIPTAEEVDILEKGEG